MLSPGKSVLFIRKWKDQKSTQCNPASRSGGSRCHGTASGKIGNIHSDGRPILGLDSHDLLEMMLDVCPEGILIPAHIWTPHFSVLGAKSGFDSVEECFEELAPYIHALETGLSSDPAMNWRISKLDRYQLVSNSDAHSPSKLGREANLLDIDCSYEGLYRAIQTGEGLEGTVEFFLKRGNIISMVTENAVYH